MKQYVNPELQLILFSSNDIMLASGNDLTYDVTEWLGGGL